RIFSAGLVALVANETQLCSAPSKPTLPSMCSSVHRNSREIGEQRHKCGIRIKATQGITTARRPKLLLLAAPTGHELTALASVARKLRDPISLRRLRRAADPTKLFDAMVQDS